jgi:hypothetical protein
MAEPPNPPKQVDTPTLTSLKTAVQQEFAHLSLVHPTPKDIPTCWDLFNTTLSCYSAKNQIKSVYRHGHRPDCSQKSSDWKYCLTIGLLDPEEKRKKWLMHRARWWAERRVGGSSEDVWDIRRSVAHTLAVLLERWDWLGSDLTCHL